MTTMKLAMEAALAAAKKSAPAEIVTTVEYVTPEQAQAWLDARYAKNRLIKKTVVASLVDDIKAGRWVLDGNAIKFNVPGVVIDGQHRLQAIALSGLTVRTMIMRGLPDSAMAVIDSGTSRSRADALTIADTFGGYRSKEIGAALGRMLDIKKGTRRELHTPNELLDMARRHPDIVKSVEAALTARHILSAPMLAALHYMGGVMCDRKEQADQLIEIMATGLVPSADCPVYKFRERLIRGKTAADARLQREELWNGLVHTWANFVHGNKILKWAPPKDTPDIIDLDKSRI